MRLADQLPEIFMSMREQLKEFQCLVGDFE